MALTFSSKCKSPIGKPLYPPVSLLSSIPCSSTIIQSFSGWLKQSRKWSVKIQRIYTLPYCWKLQHLFINFLTIENNCYRRVYLTNSGIFEPCCKEAKNQTQIAQNSKEQTLYANTVRNFPRSAFSEMLRRCVHVLNTCQACDKHRCYFQRAFHCKL